MKIDIEDSKVRAAVERLRGKKEIKILFVCLGNICRSPAAEEVPTVAVRYAGRISDTLTS